MYQKYPKCAVPRYPKEIIDDSMKVNVNMYAKPYLYIFFYTTVNMCTSTHLLT